LLADPQDNISAHKDRALTYTLEGEKNHLHNLPVLAKQLLSSTKVSNSGTATDLFLKNI